jgi:spore germination cell wall hydrolase CwlJ-like protein
LAAFNQYASLIDTKELKCLALVIYHEARGEPILGQYAVARTVVNRANSPIFPNTICKVIYQKGQFTNIRNTKIKDKDAHATAMNIALDVLANPHPFSALYFHNVKAKPVWNKRRFTKIGNHIFY